MSFTPTFTITNGITKGLTSIERARGLLEAATLSEAWVRRMSQRALLLEAHHTTHIEAAALDHLLANGRLTVGGLEGILPAVSRRSLQRDLKTLVAKGLLKEVATGPTDPYRHYVLGEL